MESEFYWLGSARSPARSAWSRTHRHHTPRTRLSETRSLVHIVGNDSISCR